MCKVKLCGYWARRSNTMPEQGYPAPEPMLCTMVLINVMPSALSDWGALGAFRACLYSSEAASHVDQVAMLPCSKWQPIVPTTQQPPSPSHPSNFIRVKKQRKQKNPGATGRKLQSLCIPSSDSLRIIARC